MSSNQCFAQLADEWDRPRAGFFASGRVATIGGQAEALPKARAKDR